MPVKRFQDLTILNLRMVLNSVSSFLEGILRVLHHGGPVTIRSQKRKEMFVSYYLQREQILASTLAFLFGLQIMRECV